MFNLFKKYFGFTKTDETVLVCLFNEDRFMSVLDISLAIGLERSGVQKAINRLCRLDLIVRQKTCFKCGGYNYKYKAVELPVLKESLLMRIHSFYVCDKEFVERYGE